MYYFASDLHGDLKATKRVFELAKLGNSKNKLFLLGDYMDRGKDGAKVPLFIMEKMKEHPNQVYALLGNHDDLFINFIRKGDTLWLANDYLDYSLVSFYKNKGKIVPEAPISMDEWNPEFYSEHIKDIRGFISKNYCEVLEWYESLPLYIELEHQVLVHAGVSSDNWKLTSKDDMLWMYSPEDCVNNTKKDLILGHIQTNEIVGNDFYGIYEDIDKKIFYIDGSTPRTERANVLSFDTKTLLYSKHENI